MLIWYYIQNQILKVDLNMCQESIMPEGTSIKTYSPFSFFANINLFFCFHFKYSYLGSIIYFFKL